jgi:hypothetical protein
MRIVSFLILFSFSIKSSAQSNFTKQLERVIADSANSFLSLKGVFKELQVKDSVYHSLITLDGTKGNDILLTKGMNMYRAVIIDSVKEKQGKKRVREWKQKLTTLLGEKFHSEEIEIVSWNPAKYGWKFKQGNLWIDITLYPYNLRLKSLYWVALGFTYF